MGSFPGIAYVSIVYINILQNPFDGICNPIHWWEREPSGRREMEISMKERDLSFWVSMVNWM
jgi:hypothetical protein